MVPRKRKRAAKTRKVGKVERFLRGLKRVLKELRSVIIVSAALLITVSAAYNSLT